MHTLTVLFSLVKLKLNPSAIQGYLRAQVGDRPASPGRAPRPALPQLVYRRYVQYEAERSPLRRKALQFGLAPWALAQLR